MILTEASKENENNAEQKAFWFRQMSKTKMQLLVQAIWPTQANFLVNFYFNKDIIQRNWICVTLMLAWFFWNCLLNCVLRKSDIIKVGNIIMNVCRQVYSSTWTCAELTLARFYCYSILVMMAFLSCLPNFWLEKLTLNTDVGMSWVRQNHAGLGSFEWPKQALY